MNKQELREKVNEIIEESSEEKLGLQTIIVTIPEAAGSMGDLTAIQFKKTAFERMWQENRPCNVIGDIHNGVIFTCGILKKMKEESYLERFIDMAFKFNNLTDFKIVDVMIIF